MLVQRSPLEQNRIIVPVSITRPVFADGGFTANSSHQSYRALIDTGAQRTVLTRSVIAAQNLMRTGHLEFAGIHGTRTHTRYLASVAIWSRRIGMHATQRDFETAEVSLFVIERAYEVVDMDDNANFDAILGFDVRKDFPFHYDAAARRFEIILQG